MRKISFMKAKFPLISFMIILMGLTFCKPTETDVLTEEEKVKITNEIESIVENFLDPNTMTYESHIGLRANVDGYVMGGDGKILYIDYESYQQGTKAVFDNFDRFIKLKATKTFVYVLGKDAASCTAEFEGAFIDLNGDTITHNGCWTFVFKQFDGIWKVVHENGTHVHE